jgi:hypothetical protein
MYINMSWWLYIPAAAYGNFTILTMHLPNSNSRFYSKLARYEHLWPQDRLS